MASVARGREALESGRLDDAQSIFLSTYDSAPGESARGLAEVALARGESERAENLARTAMENGEQTAVLVLADAVGRQGRRAEAEEIATVAVQMYPQAPYARAVLGEQLIRQGKWDEGGQRFIEAIALDEAGEMRSYFQRLLQDLTQAHRAGKLPESIVSSFLDLLEPSTAGHPQLHQVFTSARRGVASGEAMEEGQPRSRAVERTTASGGSRRSRMPPGPEPAPLMPGSASPPPERAFGQRNLPALVEIMRRDRSINRELESMLEPMGLPQWPSKIVIKLDDMPVLRPVGLDSEEGLKRTTLKLTSGSVDSEILIERALENLMRATEKGSSTRPSFDAVGMTKLEIALWDGVLDRIKPVPSVYGDVDAVDLRVLALGAYLGDGILRLTDSTWKFHDDPARSVVEVNGQALRPFDAARAWIQADDRDDVHLEEIVGLALQRGAKSSHGTPRIDPTRDLKDVALTRKLAEQWMMFRSHPSGVSQTDVAAGIRPLDVMDQIIFFACDHHNVPPFARGPIGSALVGDEVCLAYVRESGEFLCLASRKHFARAVGFVVGDLDSSDVQTVLNLFTSFHRPAMKVEYQGPQRPRLESKEGETFLYFSAGDRHYALHHAPGAPVPWRLDV